MHGFTHVRTLNVHYFRHPKLGFTIKLLPDGSGCFTSNRLDHNTDPLVVPFPAPSEDLLGAYYQQAHHRLGYVIAWYANCAHELMHIWFCARYHNKLSPNHGMLLGLHSARVEDCDKEEKIVTGLQVYANTGQLPDLTRILLKTPPAFIVAKLARQFHQWVERCVARPVGANCLLATCQTDYKPDRV